MGPGVDGGVETSSRPRMLLDGITLVLVIIKEVCLGLTRQRVGQNEFYSGYQPQHDGKNSYFGDLNLQDPDVSKFAQCGATVPY